MTENEKWRAVTENDRTYDNAFFYAVKTTGIFCRPSCVSRPPLRQNALFFPTAADALQAGFRPCKRCRPDLSEYRPVREIAEQAKELLDSCIGRQREFDRQLQALGITQHRLVEIFKQHYGVTIREYLQAAGLQRAQKLLAETDTPVLEIAEMVGFGSVSSFYRYFRGQTGMSPAAYRKTFTESEGAT